VFGLLAAGCGDDESGDAESAALDQARAETAAAQAEADAAAAQADAAAADAAAAAAQADSAATAAADAEEALAAAMADAGSSEGVDPAVVADLERQLSEAQDAAAAAGAAAAEAAEAAAAAMAAMAAAEDMAEEEMAGAELGEITTIQLIANPWNGSAANIAVAAQLLEHIGYDVEVTDLDENAQWAAMNTGDLHASLEVWPSGHADNRADFIDNPDGNVVDAGLLGPIGQIGWFLPAYMIDQYPALATAEAFTDAELARLFATAETGEAGQILHGDPSWVSFEQDLIDDFGLHLEIVYAGSEEALLAAFDGAFARDDSVLAYFWTPHVAFSSFDLVELELPLDPDGNKYYPPDNLFKIVWAGLEDGAPAAWEFLHNFNYTTADQVSMLGAIDNDGKSVEEAAADWIAANEATWSAWIPS
jgi:glycine betaine/proline transport system substrate-binding protein